MRRGVEATVTTITSWGPGIFGDGTPELFARTADSACSRHMPYSSRSDVYSAGWLPVLAHCVKVPTQVAEQALSGLLVRSALVLSVTPQRP